MNCDDKYRALAKRIRMQIEKGEKNFIIYPFGVNGAPVYNFKPHYSNA